MKRFLGAGVLLLLAFAIVVLVSRGRESSAPWFAAVSTGNGYDALVHAAAQMNGKPPTEQARAAAFVKSNEQMFQLLAPALKMPFEVPSAMYSATNSVLTDLSSFKSIALALRAKGKEAHQRGAVGDAAAAYLDIIQLGQRIEHGPLIALLVGIAIEKIGIDALEEVTFQLTPAQRKDVAVQIESFDKHRLAFSQVDLRERYYARQITMNPVKLLVARVQARPAIKKAVQRQQQLSSDFKRVANELRLQSDG